MVWCIYRAKPHWVSREGIEIIGKKAFISFIIESLFLLICNVDGCSVFTISDQEIFHEVDRDHYMDGLFTFWGSSTVRMEQIRI